MSLVMDILIVAFLALGGYAGWKAGILKTLVKFVGIVAIIIMALSFKDTIVAVLFKYLPFFNYGGIFNDLFSINIFVYNAIAFLIIFILLYCLLSIVLSVTGFLNTLLNLTIVWILPSKILGAIVGVLSAWVYLLAAIYILGQLPPVAGIVYESNLAPVMMKYTPIVNKMASKTTDGMNDIIKMLKKVDKDTDRESLDLQILTKAMSAGLINQEQFESLILDEKLKMDNVMFG